MLTEPQKIFPNGMKLNNYGKSRVRKSSAYCFIIREKRKERRLSMKLMTRGDAGYVPLKIKSVAMADVESIEFTIHNISKMYRSDGSGEVTYDSDSGVFDFPISQAESLALPDTNVGIQARVMFADSFKVQGTDTKQVNIGEVLSEVIIK